MIRFERNDGKEFKFGDVFKVTEITGIGTLSAENYTEKKAFGNGDILIGKRVPSRIINISSRCTSTALTEIARQTARRFFNNNYMYKMHINYTQNPVWIACTVDLVDMPTEGVKGLLGLNLSLFCPDPFFRSLNEFGKDIASIKPMFSFPLISPIGKGFTCGVYHFARNVFIDNDGDEQTFCKAIIKAEGNVENFRLSKNDDEYILFTQDLKEGDELVIDFVNCTAILNGNNVIHKIDRRSTFFSIDVGGSNIKYSADTGENLVKVYIYYNKLYAGV